MKRFNLSIGVEDHPRMCGENTKKSLSHQRLPIVKIPFFMSLSASAIVAVASDNA